MYEELIIFKNKLKIKNGKEREESYVRRKNRLIHF